MILREINFCESRSWQNCVFAIFETLDIGHFSEPTESAKIFRYQNPEPVDVLK